MLCLLASCAAATPTTNNAVPAEEPAAEIFASIQVKHAGKQFLVEIIFFTDISEIVNGKVNRGFGKNIREVGNPNFNGKAIKGIADEFKHTTYSLETDKLLKKNTITFSFEAKDYISKGEFELTDTDMSKAIEFLQIKEKKN